MSDLNTNLRALMGVATAAVGKSDKWTEEMQKRAIRMARLERALERIRDCDWVITLPDRMDAVRQIAREALE